MKTKLLILLIICPLFFFGQVANNVKNNSDITGTLTVSSLNSHSKHIDIQNADLGKGATAPSQVIIGNNSGWEYSINDDSHMTFLLPHDWEDGTDLIINVCWAIDEAFVTNSGEVRWEAQWSATAIGEDVSVAGTTDNSGDINIPTLAYDFIESIVETIPGASLSAGDIIGMDIRRVAIDGGTPNPGTDPAILAVHIEYTSNILGE